jgi:hypothetical protein
MSLVVYIGVMKLVEMHEGRQKHPEEAKMTAVRRYWRLNCAPLLFQRDGWTEAPTAFVGCTFAG